MLDLLFILCTWHALAKLRLHTSSTLQALKSIAKALGQQLRHWVKKMCSAFDTWELPKEESARHRRKAAAASKPDKGKGTRSLQIEDEGVEDGLCEEVEDEDEALLQQNLQVTVVH
jgi:hypothetical protein